jgi:nitrate/nitrite transporter NarK
MTRQRALDDHHTPPRPNARHNPRPSHRPGRLPEHPGTGLPAAPAKGGTTIETWDPEDATFWETTGRSVARRNLTWSILVEHIGFSTWLLWSVSATLPPKAGFGFTAAQLFALVAIPNLVGALVRLPCTFAIARFGGRNWTTTTALLLLAPTLAFAVAVQQPATPYWAFCLIAVTGLGGGNFASSMASINFFYPARAKGVALGLNAAGGNLGVAVIQFAGPLLVGAGGAFGLISAAGSSIHLARLDYLYAALAGMAAVAGWRFMNNLAAAKASPREQLAVVKYADTWVMSFLYLGTFGSFIGYAAAMPLLIKVNFWFQPVPDVTGIGINFAHCAFLGALVGSITRPFGGRLADKFGGGRVTAAAFVAMTVGTLAVLYTLTLLQPVHHIAPTIQAGGRPLYDIGVQTAVAHNSHVFGLFLTPSRSSSPPPGSATDPRTG